MNKLCKITGKTRRDWGKEGNKRDWSRSCGGESKTVNSWSVGDEDEPQAY